MDKNRKANVKQVVLGALIVSMLLLTSMLEKQNPSALTSGDRYTSGFSHAEQQAAIDFQNNSTFNPVCVKHTSYYCTGYVKGYNATWNNLAPKRSNPTPNPHAHNSTSPPAFNISTTTANPPTVISSSTESRVVPFIIFVIVVVIIAGIARKLKHRRGKYKERQHFSDSIKEKVLEKQHHRCDDCNRVLNVVDWHHKNGDRSDNRESNCVALCPNCHAIRTRTHR
jgi:hypothetical protein